VSDADLNEILKQVNLPDIVERVGGLDVDMNWSDLLSLGEQQRIAFARVLLSGAKYVILDEATSALDVDNEKCLYALLKARGITFISVGHRPTLAEFHSDMLELKVDGQWATTGLSSPKDSSTKDSSPEDFLQALRESVPKSQPISA
jgi:putative ATP-binding cassette transporter